MSGGSSKQTVGHKYYWGGHWVLGLGVFDQITRIRFAGKDAWCGTSTGGRIDINAPKLFGGEKREGGIVAAVDFLPGGPDQQVNDYLLAQLGAPLPAFRAVSSVVFRQGYWGMNPYPKRFEVRGQRVFTRSFGEPQWYPEKAGIPACSVCTVNAAIYIALDLSGSMAGSRLTDAKTAVNGFLDYLASLLEEFPDGRLDIMIVGWGGTFANLMERVTITHREVDADDIAALKAWVSARDAIYYTHFPSATADAADFFQGAVDLAQRISLFVTDGAPNSGFNSPIDPGDQAISNAYAVSAGEELLAIEGLRAFGFNIQIADTTWTQLLDNTPQDGVPVILDGQPETMLSALSASVSQAFELNCAHVIRELITDPVWAVRNGYLEPDDDNFRAVADVLYAEGQGFGYFWRREGPIENMIDEVMKQIGGELYVQRATGKIRIKLIRDDYDADALLTLDQDSVDRVENDGAPAIDELVSSYTVIYRDCATGTEQAVTVHNGALARNRVGTVARTYKYFGVRNRQLATDLAWRDLRALSQPLRRRVVYANRTAAVLEQGDAFRLSWPEYGDGPMIMRVAEIAFGNGDENLVRIRCVEDVFSLGPMPVITPMPTRWRPPLVAPLPASDRLVFEAPYYALARELGDAQAIATLDNNEYAGYLMAAARRPGTAINAEIYADAGAGYREEGQLEFCGWAVVADAVSVEHGPTVVALSEHEDLDLVEIGSLGTLGNEIVRVDAINLASIPATITLGRGCLDTVPQAHTAGARLALWQDLAGYSTTQYAAGASINVKLLPVTGGGQVGLSDAPVDALTFAQRAFRPYPPGDFRINGQEYPDELEIADFNAVNAISVSFAHRDRLQQTAATVEDTTAGDIGPEVGTTYTVELRDASDDSLFDSAAGETDSPVEFALTGFVGAALRVVLASVRDGVESWQRHVHDVIVQTPLWTPANLTAVPPEWFDDQSGITYSGSNVTGWQTRGSGSGLTSISGDGPTVLENHLNGRRVMQFPGSRGMSGVDGNLFRNVSSAWVFAVYRLDITDVSGVDRTITVWSTNSNAQSTRVALYAGTVANANKPLFGARRLDANAGASAQGTTAAAERWVMVMGIANYAARTIQLYVDGEIDASLTSQWDAAGNTTDLATLRGRVGRNLATSSPVHLNGKIAALLHGRNNVPTDAEIDRLFGWAAWHFGLEASLDAGHPYKLAPPRL